MATKAAPTEILIIVAVSINQGLIMSTILFIFCLTWADSQRQYVYFNICCAVAEFIFPMASYDSGAAW
jgi:hypothetical protein